MTRERGLKHVLFVHAADELYGADKVLLGLVQGLDRSRFRSTVVLPDDVAYDGGLSAQLRASGIAVRHLRLAVLRRKYFNPVGAVKLAWWCAGSGARLARFARREQVDLVFSHTAAVVSGALAASLGRRPHIWHTLEIVVRPAAVRRALAWLLPRASVKVVAASNAVREHLIQSNPAAAARTVVIRNGIDPQPFLSATGRKRVRAELGIPDDAPLVGMIGRVGTWKGQELLLSAAPHVSRLVPGVRFVLVGGVFDGQMEHFERLRDIAREQGVADRVIFSDFRTDVPDVLAAIDVFVQPSIQPDPFPTTVLEAMAAGKPVIATNHGGHREMIVPGITGFLVTPAAPADLAARAVQLLSDPALAQRMGMAGRQRVAAEFSADSFTRACAALFDEVLDHGE